MVTATLVNVAVLIKSQLCEQTNSPTVALVPMAIDTEPTSGPGGPVRRGVRREKRRRPWSVPAPGIGERITAGWGAVFELGLEHHPVARRDGHRNGVGKRVAGRGGLL